MSAGDPLAELRTTVARMRLLTSVWPSEVPLPSPVVLAAIVNGSCECIELLEEEMQREEERS